MDFTIYWILLILGAFVNVQGRRRIYDSCNEDEYYDACKLHCQPTCGALDGKSKCDKEICIPGCICAHGLFRRNDYKCVENKRCFYEDAFYGWPPGKVDISRVKAMKEYRKDEYEDFVEDYEERSSIDDQ